MAIAKCAHPGCACLPAEHEEYCSEHCAEVSHHEMPEEKGCLCGHAGCDPRAARLSDATTGQNITSDIAPRH